MITVTATAARRPGVNSKASAFIGCGSPMDPIQRSLARFALNQWRTARTMVESHCGSADPTPEYEAARDRYEAFDGDDDEYDRAALDDLELLSRVELASHSRFVGLTVAGPNSTERAVWLALRSAEVDLVRVILAINCPPDPAMPRPATITIDGYRFSYQWLDENRDPNEARLIVEWGG